MVVKILKVYSIESVDECLELRAMYRGTIGPYIDFRPALGLTSDCPRDVAEDDLR